MKKVIFTGVLCFVVGLSFGQKKTVSAAKNEIKGSNPNIAEARSLIKEALENPETKDQAETWFVAGQIEDKQFDLEKTKELLGQKPDEAVMYSALANIWPYLEKAAELDQLPDAKGKVKPKFIKDIKSIIKADRASYYNAGVYYYNNKEYQKAYDLLKLYGDLKTVDLMKGEQWENQPADSTETQIRYYAGIAAAYIPNHPAAIEILEGLKGHQFPEGLEEELYTNIAREYNAMNDTQGYNTAIKAGYEKFPTNGDFLRGMINQSIQGGNYNEAVAYLDAAIAKEPENGQFYNLLGQVYEIQYNSQEDKNAAGAQQYIDKSIENLKKAVELEGNKNASFNSDLGRIFFNLAVEKRTAADESKDKAVSDKLLLESTDYMSKALPYFEKAYDLNGDDLKTINALRMIYYQVKQFDKYDQFDKIYNSKTGGSEQ
ncbi:MAG: tetratricopeptide repeat protein [Dysgonamonadaceae bacterium]|jgi:Flp pilus assembly protein TadD|nr:tetratricopeptide repeat protein [Dysgonamonadaceae bacterium]